MTTPPQQQPPAPGQPAPGQPPQPPQAPLAAPGQAPAAPAKKGIKVPRLVISIVVLIVLAGVGWYLSRDDALNAKTGDCLHQKGANDLAIVKCDSSDANFKVLGRVEDKTESETNADDICAQWDATTATYWEGKSGQKGTVLCLQAK
ncbi:hypothetical protein Dvina_25325 [Dactylosporangium vinaceum]|uniref:Uncharacterized protein n=1 Tax=Dactylosporangium vinaceum TaxID=53362 RepID=A0ABV5MDR0_9ACTN|nr:hypothetical protein [Dactylosporangium vinaceum]UAC01081.1 hypothetical protein Dvina_25325 [Dactylosporangium vinaceum]